jgi:p-cumate 2,3-dioxygenase ferredoxin subunit
MTERIAIGKLGEYPVDQITPATLPDGTVIAVYNVDGTLYATADLCTHGESSLSEEGTLMGTTVECAWHSGTFDVRTGAATGMPCQIPLQAYPVEVVDGDVFVEA